MQGQDWTLGAGCPCRRYFKRVHDGSRIVYFPGQDPTDDFWEVTDTNGIKYRYGSRPDSRLSNRPTSGPGSGVTGKTFRWNLDEVEDPQGNSYRIEYMGGDTDLTPSTPSAPNGPLDQSWAAYLYPRRIRYSYHDGAAGSQTVRLVVLNWEGRNDFPTSYRSGFMIGKNQRLAAVDIGFDTNGDGQIGSGERIRRYALTYAGQTTLQNPDLPPFTRLDSIQRYGSDNLPFPQTASAPSLTPISTTFTYTENLVNGTKRSFQAAPSETYGNYGYIRAGQANRVELALDGRVVDQAVYDMNRDGILDLVTTSFNPNAINVEGEDWLISGTTACPARAEHLQEDRILGFFAWRVSDLIDMDGDGLPDRVVTQGDTGSPVKWCVFRNNGAGFDLPVEWIAPNAGVGFNTAISNYDHYEYPPIYQLPPTVAIASLLADLNGDGRPDYVSTPAPGMGPPPNTDTDWFAVALNHGAGFYPPVFWSHETPANVPS
ncbi:MAG: SpvB/TcaC N-terminal domain-containing protein, partial [Gemmatimonadales bacterium]